MQMALLDPAVVGASVAKESDLKLRLASAMQMALLSLLDPAVVGASVAKESDLKLRLASAMQMALLSLLDPAVVGASVAKKSNLAISASSEDPGLMRVEAAAEDSFMLALLVSSQDLDRDDEGVGEQILITRLNTSVFSSHHCSKNLLTLCQAQKEQCQMEAILVKWSNAPGRV